MVMVNPGTLMGTLGEEVLSFLIGITTLMVTIFAPTKKEAIQQ